MAAPGLVQSQGVPISQQKTYDSGLHWPGAVVPFEQSQGVAMPQQKMYESCLHCKMRRRSPCDVWLRSSRT